MKKLLIIEKNENITEEVMQAMEEADIAGVELDNIMMLRIVKSKNKQYIDNDVNLARAVKIIWQ